jgi:hypothetical protein
MAAVAALVAGGLAFWFVRPEPTKLESHVAFLGALKAQRMNDLGGDPQPLASIFMPVAFNHAVTNFMMTSGPEQRLPAKLMAAVSSMAGSDDSRFMSARANFGTAGASAPSSAGPYIVAEQVNHLRRLLADEKGLCTLSNLDWVVSTYRDYSQARDLAVRAALVSDGDGAARSEAARWRSTDIWLADRLSKLSRDGYLAIPAGMRRAAAPILWEIRETIPNGDRCPELRVADGPGAFQRPAGSGGFQR